jgi:hypothetical protein
MHSSYTGRYLATQSIKPKDTPIKGGQVSQANLSPTVMTTKYSS